MTVAINKEICGFCLGCATICPKNVFKVENQQLIIEEGCIDCGLCIECCPVKAISTIERKD